MNDAVFFLSMDRKTSTKNVSIIMPFGFGYFKL